MDRSTELHLRSNLQPLSDRSTGEILAELIELLPFAALCVGRAGEVLLENGRARKLIHALQPEPSRRALGLLGVAALDAVLTPALRRAEFSVGELSAAPERVIYSVGASDAGAWIFAQRPGETVPSVDALRRCWGLSPTQASVVVGVCEGLSVTQVAARLGIGVQTVRGHMKHIFSRSGYRRQVDLVRACCGLPLLVSAASDRADASASDASEPEGR